MKPVTIVTTPFHEVVLRGEFGDFCIGLAKTSYGDGRLAAVKAARGTLFEIHCAIEQLSEVMAMAGFTSVSIEATHK